MRRAAPSLTSSRTCWPTARASRLYKRLVYELQIAQNVFAFQSRASSVSFLAVVATARPGHTIPELVKVIDEEMARLRTAPPEVRELQRVINGYEADFYDGIERVASRADQLNAYATTNGQPGLFRRRSRQVSGAVAD